MKIKVCGMREVDNIKEVVSSQPDYMGFIFYKESKRYIHDQTLEFLKSNDLSIKKIGVFVNHDIDILISTVQQYDLDLVQLHGTESPAYVEKIRNENIAVIKAFSIDQSFDWDSLEAYFLVVDYFLFDTSCSTYGGSGKKFDWQLLLNYHHDKPFFLSGGISMDDVESLRNLELPMLYSIDINSRFEIEPGLKDKKLITRFLNKLRDEKLPS